MPLKHVCKLKQNKEKLDSLDLRYLVNRELAQSEVNCHLVYMSSVIEKLLFHSIHKNNF